ncbi:Putative permease of the major facilitator superfamily (fragment) [Bradyrhizobium sp. ORS 285]
MAVRNCGADDFVRYRPNARAIRRRAITDAMGSLTYALNASAVLLLLGAVMAAMQKKLKAPDDASC